MTVWIVVNAKEYMLGEKTLKKRLFYFLAFILLLMVEIFIALFVHDRFVRPYIGDVLVVIVLYFLIRIFLPEGCGWLPGIIFLFATGVEILQYFRLVERLGLSDSRLMRLVLGSVYDFRDILCYGAGCVLLQIGQWLYSRIFRNMRKERPDIQGEK